MKKSHHIVSIRFLLSLGVCILLTNVAPSTGFAQVGHPNSIVMCGAVLTPGMPPLSAIKAIRDAGECAMIKHSESNSSLEFQLDDKEGAVRGTLDFHTNELWEIDEFWDVAVHNQFDYANALARLFSQLKDEGNGTCTIHNLPNSNPKLNVQMIALDCGRKHVFIGSFSTGTVKGSQISEVITAKN